MTPTKRRTLGPWQVLDDKGDIWRIQCVCCQHTRTLARQLLQGAVTPLCPRCGARTGHTIVKELPPEISARACTWGIDVPPNSGAARPQIPPPAGFVHSAPEPADLPELDPILPVGAKRVRDRRKADPKPLPVPQRYLAGESYGSLTVLREGERQGKNRTVIVSCGVCGQEWRVSVQNLARTREACTCVHRWRQSAAHRETVAAQVVARRSRRADWLRARKVAEVDRLIRACEAKLAKLQARRAALTPPATVADSSLTPIGGTFCP